MFRHWQETLWSGSVQKNRTQNVSLVPQLWALNVQRTSPSVDFACLWMQIYNSELLHMYMKLLKSLSPTSMIFITSNPWKHIAILKGAHKWFIVEHPKVEGLIRDKFKKKRKMKYFWIKTDPVGKKQVGRYYLTMVCTLSGLQY